MDELPNYKYRSKDLIKVFIQVGISSTEKGARKKLERLIADGKLTPPKIAAEERGDYVFTKEQVIEIAKAFGPGGKGEWHFSGVL